MNRNDSRLDFVDLQKKLGYTFKNHELLEQAFTHISYANDNETKSYERLEFLGDSILGSVTAKYLFNRFPDCDEGFLTKTRAIIVSTKVLAKVVAELGIIKYLRVSGCSSVGEICSSEGVKADLFEAIVGAILLDSGIESCEKFILEKLEHYMNADFTAENITDYKSKLLEKYAKSTSVLEFKSVQTVENDIRSGFTATILLDGKPIAEGRGESKKKAEQVAAEKVFAQENNIKSSQ